MRAVLFERDVSVAYTLFRGRSMFNSKYLKPAVLTYHGRLHREVQRCYQRPILHDEENQSRQENASNCCENVDAHSPVELSVNCFYTVNVLVPKLRLKILKAMCKSCSNPSKDHVNPYKHCEDREQPRAVVSRRMVSVS
jgi:hypothetical protein